MNKYTIVAIICLSFLAGCTNFEKTIEKIADSTHSSESNQPRDKEQIKKSVVKITSQGRQGTGFIVGLMSGTVYILTVSHVVASDPAPNIEFFGQTREFKARVLEIEGQQENGFALLVVTGSIPSEAIPLHVDNKFDLKPGDSVFTFGFPRSGGNWAYDELSYSSRIAREILFSGSDMKEGNSGSPLIKGDEVVGMVTSVTDFAHANSSAGIREFLQGAKGGNIVLEQMGKWGVNWREAYDKHLEKISMLAEQQRIASDDELARLRIVNMKMVNTVDSNSSVELAPLFNEADKNFDQGNFEAAAKLFEQAAQISFGKEETRIYAGLYRSLFKLGHLDRAEEAMAKLVAAAASENDLAFHILFKAARSDVAGLANPDEYEIWIRQIGKYFNRTKQCLKVIGHTNVTGNRNYEMKLSRRRAMTVKKLLEYYYPEGKSRIISVGVGSDKCKDCTPNNNDLAKVDQRVELKIIDCIHYSQ